MQINTVRGPIEPDQLGRTLFHEHFVFGYPGFEGDATIAPFREQDYMKICRNVIQDVKKQGFRTIIDLTPNDCGRNPEFLRKIAVENDFNILCATGYYFQDEGASVYFNFRSLFSDIVSELSELMLAELTKGIRDTGIKAAVIKLGTSKDKITSYEEAVIKAAVRAQKETGAPILTHTQSGTMGPEQAALLIAEGADPKKTVIGHMCGNVKDMEYQLKTLEKGVGIGFDRIGTNELFCDITDDDRVNTIIELVKKGYGNRIYLSHDTVNCWLGRDVSGFYEIPGTKDWNIRRIGDFIIPKLMAGGLTDSQIEQLLTANVMNLWED